MATGSTLSTRSPGPHHTTRYTPPRRRLPPQPTPPRRCLPPTYASISGLSLKGWRIPSVQDRIFSSVPQDLGAAVLDPSILKLVAARSGQPPELELVNPPPRRETKTSTRRKCCTPTTRKGRPDRRSRDRATRAALLMPHKAVRPGRRRIGRDGCEQDGRCAGMQAICSRGGFMLGKKNILTRDYFPGCQDKRLAPHNDDSPTYRHVTACLSLLLHPSFPITN